MTGVARLDGGVLSAIAAGAAAAYPNEGCGALLGPAGETVRPDGPGDGASGAAANGLRVTETLAVPNSESGTPRDRFEVAPRDYLAVEDEADRRGLSLLGFWHSHPDGEARPSATDRAYAWEGLLTVIVAVPARVPGDIGAWQIAGPEAPFTPVQILENENGHPVTSLLLARPSTR